jgi:hypothetical protein
MELLVGIITLFVAIATLYVSFITYRYTKQSDKKRKIEELARKQALLDSFNKPYAMFGLDSTVSDQMRMKQNMLKVEIEELKKQLR